ncbi:MAG: sigma-54-dependent transcriptional regulator [Phycisphaerales bacterium JB038]
MSRVLVVDDKEMMRDSVATTLQRAGMTVVGAANADAAENVLRKQRPDAVVTDLRMPGTDGLGLLEKIKAFDESLPVVLMTAYGTVDTAVEAMKLGAFDYITKPFEGDELIITVKRALQHAQLLKENAVLRSQTSVGDPGEAGGEAGVGLKRLIGSSNVMRHLREEIAAIARSNGTVLVCGESGTGKELVSHAIHESSTRGEQTYLAVNCAALSASLLESELFGHERGAFTGADQLRKGRFELADGGSLLLDEISEIAPHLQAKLLRVLQESAFERVGSSLTQNVDVRVIATTNRELLDCVQMGSFRQDLYFRLTVLPIRVPPLRERLEDVPELSRHFLQRVAQRDGTPLKRMSDGAIAALQQYAWPGNVRELQNICERAHVLSPSEEIESSLIRPWLQLGLSMPAASPAALPVAPTVVEPKVAPAVHANGNSQPAELPLPEVHVVVDEPVRPLEEIERDAVVAALKEFGGHRQKTAEALGIGVRTLGLKLKKWKQLELVAQDL